MIQQAKLWNIFHFVQPNGSGSLINNSSRRFTLTPSQFLHRRNFHISRILFVDLSPSIFVQVQSTVVILFIFFHYFAIFLLIDRQKLQFIYFFHNVRVQLIASIQSVKHCIPLIHCAHSWIYKKKVSSKSITSTSSWRVSIKISFHSNRMRFFFLGFSMVGLLWLFDVYQTTIWVGRVADFREVSVQARQIFDRSDLLWMERITEAEAWTRWEKWGFFFQYGSRISCASLHCVRLFVQISEAMFFFFWPPPCYTSKFQSIVVKSDFGIYFFRTADARCESSWTKWISSWMRPSIEKILYRGSQAVNAIYPFRLDQHPKVCDSMIQSDKVNVWSAVIAWQMNIFQFFTCQHGYRLLDGFVWSLGRLIVDADAVAWRIRSDGRVVHLFISWVWCSISWVWCRQSTRLRSKIYLNISLSIFFG